MSPDPSTVNDIVDDPVLGPKMLSLLSRELKAARLRIEELERKEAPVNDHAVGDQLATAAAADRALSLQKELDDAVTENRLLRTALEEGNEVKKKVKNKSKIIKMFVDKAVLTDDVDPDSDEKEVGQLIEQVEKYRAKYKAHKALKKDLAETCQNLEAELSTLRAEHQQLVTKSESTSKIQGVHPATTSMGNNISWDTLHNFMKNLSVTPKSRRIPYDKLQPICHRSVDLKTYLASDPQMARCSKNFLHLPDLLIWSPEKVNVLALGPLHTYDETCIANWKQKSIFDVLYNKTFSLFEQEDDFVFYLGTYKAINLLEQLNEGISISEIDENVTQSHFPVNSRCLASLVQSSIPNSHRQRTKKESGKLDDSLSPGAVQALYLEGALKVEPLGLQYVEFDAALYGNMLKRFKGAQPVVVLPDAATISVAHPLAPPGPASNGKYNNKRTANPSDASRARDSKKRRLSEDGSVSKSSGHHSQPKHHGSGSGTADVSRHWHASRTKRSYK